MSITTTSLRDKRQHEFAEAFLNRAFDRGGILYLCPRFGKCRTGIRIMKALGKPKVLICYPDSNIKQSWVDDLKEMKYKGDITYTTYLSLHKHTEEWDLVILDEIHLMSEAQKEAMSDIKAKEVLGLTGTMTEWTQKELKRDLGLHVIAEYPIEKAIEEGVVTDYEINIVKIPLDNKIIKYVSKKGKKQTEKQKFDAYSYVIAKMEEEAKEKNRRPDTKILRLARMRIIKDSVAKIEATRKVLKENKGKRVLVFCGHNAICDALGCPSYHSGNKNQEAFNAFLEGEGEHMAVCKLGNTGKTYKPLDRVVLNYFDSNAENLAQKINRCMGMEYNNPSKKAYITIITSNEPTELKWLDKALEFFDETKIKYGSA